MSYCYVLQIKIVMKLAYFPILYFGLCYCFTPSNYRQERARVNYFNPKYIKHAEIFTARNGRRDAYRTNMTAESITTWTNNTTMSVIFNDQQDIPLALTYKLCDATRIRWLTEYLTPIVDFELKCPFPPKNYSAINMEFKPIIPLPILNKDYKVSFLMFVTATKEPVIDVSVMLKYERKAKNH